MPKRARYHQEEEESVFVSMTDIMVGLLFIFSNDHYVFRYSDTKATRIN